MRRVRPQRRGFLDLRRITIGDYVVLAAALLTVISLFLPWFSISVPVSHTDWAFTYSEWASVVVIVFFLATLFLVVYPALSPDLRMPPLPFSTPVVFLFLGGALLLIFVFEWGKYVGVLSPGSPGIGVYLGLIAAIVFVVGAVIKWGSRPSLRRADSR